MRKVIPPDLDYLPLIKASRKPLDVSCCSRKLRVAVLGDCAPQQVVAVLRVLFCRHGIDATLYEADYDTIGTEVHDAGSGLFASAPDVVVILSMTQALKARYHGRDVSERAAFATDALHDLVDVWDAIAARSTATVLQSTFVLPVERAFGNYEQSVAGSLTDVVQALNRGIVEQSRARKSVFVHDIDYLAAAVGRMEWTDDRLWIVAKSPCSFEHLPRLCQNVVDVTLATLGGSVKCVVLDLDNTMWGGVIGDDGMDGIKLGHLGDGEAFHALQQFMLGLYRRGILLAVCSKNTYEVAIQPFRSHPEMVLREEHIVAFVANWQDKAANIAKIRETLNIGYDSMVFVDDNPFERNLVRELLPEVIVPELPEDPADYVKALAALNLFETVSFSDLDRQRSDLYRQEEQRDRARQRFENVDEYLASLEMKLVLERFDRFTLPRIAQLIQRSNQFNLATRRYNEAQCEALMGDPAKYPFSVSLRDKVGDYGLISVVILDLASGRLVIDEYLMSCRVLQRGVEHYVMNEIVSLAKARAIPSVEGTYRPTAKNAMVREFYPQFGFVEKGTDEFGSVCWQLDVSLYVPRKTFIERVIDERRDASPSPV